MWFSGVLLLGENINTLSRSCFVDNIDDNVCLCFYLQTINIKWLYVHTTGNKQYVEMAWPGKAALSCALFTLIRSSLVS